MPSERRLRRDAVLAVRPPWREVLALVLTALIVVSLPLAAWGVATTSSQMAKVERAAITLEEIGPQASDIATTLADVTRRLAELGDQYGPALTQVSEGVEAVTGELAGLADDLRPLASTLGAVADVLRGDGGTNEVADALTQVQDAMTGVSDTVDGVADTTSDVAEQVRLLTSPSTLAVLADAADAVDGLAGVTERASDLAGRYVDNAEGIALAAQVVTVASLAASIAWLAWRVGEHRRWSRLRRAGAGREVVAAVGRALR